MANPWNFGVVNVCADHLKGRRHLTRFLNRNTLICIPMKDPYRQTLDLFCHRSVGILFRSRFERWIEDAARLASKLKDEAADYDDCGESIRIVRRQIPGAVAARG